VRGDEEAACRRRDELVADYGVTRVIYNGEGSTLTVGDLLQRWLVAPHLWKRATVVSHQSVVRFLSGDAIARRRLVLLTPSCVATAIGRWRQDGLSVSTVSGRWLVLRSAVSWAVGEGLLRSNPLVGMRGPARPQPRRHHTFGEVRLMLSLAESMVAEALAALAADPESLDWRQRAFRAEQDLLLVRLAADSGARRGELAVLRMSDLDGRVLTIERGLSQGQLASTKSGRTRRLTVGATTASLIVNHFWFWAHRGPAPMAGWIFAPSPARDTYMTADALTHRFRRIGRAAGVTDPSLHRLRHGVATHLVDAGKLLKAQARLGHRDPSTTLRHYSHAVPLDDRDVADAIDALLNGAPS
jgi:integrase